MSNIFKVTYIFEGRSCGWTESLWLNAANRDHSKQVPIVEKLARLRAQVLASPCFIKGYRISLDDSGPDALLSYTRFDPIKVNIDQVGVGSLGPAAERDVAIQVRCSPADRSKRKFIFMRGVPDNIESNNGEYLPSVIFRNLMDKYIKGLTDGSWGWMGVDDAQATKKVPILNVEEAVNGTTTFTFKANLFPITLPVNARVKIRVSGVNKKSPANGVHVVYAVDRTTALTVNSLAPGKYHFGGWGNYTPLKFITIEEAEDQKIVERHAGAPLLLSRGRKPARARG